MTGSVSQGRETPRHSYWTVCDEATDGLGPN